MAESKIPKIRLTHITIPESNITAANGTLWTGNNEADVWYNEDIVILRARLFFKNTSEGVLSASIQVPNGIPLFNSAQPIGRAYRLSNGVLLNGDICQSYHNTQNNIVVTERNMLTSKMAANFASITIDSGVISIS